MENTPRKTISFQIPTADELASENRRPLAPVSFALAIILFFFSFMDLRCTNGRKIASVTGFQLVAGKEFNTSGLLNGGFDSNLFGTETTDADESQRMPPNPWAILALLSAVGGLVVFIRRFTWENLVVLLLLEWALLTSVSCGGPICSMPGNTPELKCILSLNRPIG